MTPILQLDFDCPLTALERPQREKSARALVRFHGAPIGLIQVQLNAGRCSAHRVAKCVVDQLGQAIVRHLLLDALAVPRSDPWRTPELLEVAHPVHVGGLPESSGPYLAPDATVERGWQQAVGRLFDLDPQVTLISGPLLALEAQTPSDAVSAWGFQRFWWQSSQMEDFDTLERTARALAQNGNVAIRDRVVGGCTSRDLTQICMEVLRSGHLCVYEPAALAWTRSIPRQVPMPTIESHRLWSAPGRVAVRTIELTNGISSLDDARTDAEVRLFILRDGRPLGVVQVAHGGRSISAARLGDTIVSWLWHKLVEDDWRTIRRSLLDRYVSDDEVSPAPRDAVGQVFSVSIVVGTRDRPDDLRQCLTSMRGQETRHRVEIVVVDNHPASGLTPPVLAEFPMVRLVEEPRRGLSYARNAGILASSGDLIVTTDDDVVAPPTWLERLVTPFQRADVAIVTGNILPLELETRAQQLFEFSGGLGRGFDRIEADAEWFNQYRWRAVPTWLLGATANAAFRANVFRDARVGMFSEELGVGTPSGGGEDLYIFYRALKADFTLVYAPAAFVWHRHRRHVSDLRRQLFGYSTSFVAYQLETLLREHDWRALVHLCVRIPRGYALGLRQRLRGKYQEPWWMTLVQVAGNISGPLALFRSHRRIQRRV